MYCAISKQIYLDPVITSDGHTYEREFIEEWIRKQLISPLTGRPIARNLIPNIAVKQLVEDYLTKNPDKKSDQYVIVNSISKYEKKFCDAVSKKDWPSVLKFEDFTINSDEQYTAIHNCFNLGNDDVVEHIIKKSKLNNPRLVNVASASISPRALQLLLNDEDIKKLGVSYLFIDKEGNCPLLNAIIYGHIDNVKLLIERKVIEKNPHLYNTHLVAALYTEDYEKILVMIKIDCNHVSYLLSVPVKEILNPKYNVSYNNILEVLNGSKLDDEQKIIISEIIQKKIRQNIKRKITEINADEEDFDSMITKVTKVTF